MSDRIKKAGLFICISFLIFFFAFASRVAGPVKGSVNPPDGGLRAFLFSATDTFKAEIVGGNFTLTNVKPGTYNLLIEAKPPYRNGIKPDIRVLSDDVLDLGVIEMQK